jgi:hypothetical protein
MATLLMLVAWGKEESAQEREGSATSCSARER